MKQAIIGALLGSAVTLGVLAATGHLGSKSTFTPGLGEIMGLNQMRHAKLWFAGSQGNWDLAAYELDELKEGFDDAQQLHSVHDGVPVGSMIRELTPKPLDDLEGAIHGKDQAAFTAAFDRLTDTCNRCHQAAERGYVVIQRPDWKAYGNQDFSVRRVKAK